MLYVILSFILIGLFILFMSIPLIYFNIPFGHWYGIRFTETLSNKTLWEKANKFAGRLLFNLSLSIIFISVILSIFVKADIFAYIMGIYIYFCAIFFYKKTNSFIKKNNN